ncbi:hypothetical protein [Hymenobacter jeollabukensis]|uniref:Uncharacterized protein n=1 Tax=Hymenobacter jeollabukensis TaxID=2025313 RepID=A0A5R8WNI7_9BACT|nr:hypothetical protein [Hymenobacter jeollabukensis]TLM91130.1 hypothetical protein FDY95_16165 [Hymenobacter jeollabukensis]
MLRKLLLIALLGGFFNCGLLLVVSLFSVTWGAPKPAWLTGAALLVDFSGDLNAFGRYFFWAAALNGAIWASGLYLLSYALKRQLASVWAKRNH